MHLESLQSKHSQHKRKQQIEIVQQQFTQKREAIFMGDMNFDDSEMREIVDQDNYLDVWEIAKERDE